MDKIYIIEDDENIRNLLKIALEGFGYEAEGFETAEEGLERIKEEVPSLAIFDWMLPGMDGVTAIRKIRQTDGLQELPIMLLTAKEKELDKVVGLDCGADDYMVKPVNVNEMVLRVGALLRRAQILSEHKIIIGSTEFDYDQMTVKIGSEIQVLPKKEFLLLYKLAASPGRTFTKQQLMDDVWGVETEADQHTIEVHIGRIRERFKENSDFEIVTMRGIGYKVVKKS